MTKVLAHRGPDAMRLWMNETEQLLLGHTRLSIVDLSERGSQPMTYMNRYTIVYNGEIYNYLSVKNRLKTKGYTFYSNTDTEVLLALYDEKREECLEDLIGMFAFAIWDDVNKTLFLARDRIGKKPLYYYFDSEKFMFASEIKSLLAGGVKKEINYKMLYKYLVYGTMFNPQNLIETFYNNINKLEAAHYILIDTQNWLIKKERYWNLEIKNQINSFQQAKEITESVFLDALKVRIPTDVRICSTLSGGLDSTLIVSALIKKKLLPYPLHTFSARFPGFKKDEGNFIEEVLKKYEVENTNIEVTDDVFINDYEELFYYQDEPYDGASYLAEYEVLKAVKNHGLRVMFDGQGADEIFGGYPTYFYTIFQNILRYRPLIFLREYFRYNEIAENSLDINLRFILKTLMPKLFVHLKRIRDYYATKRIYNKDFRIIYSETDNYFLPQYTDINQHMYRDTVGGYLENMLKCTDRSAMANSVEVRMPFLDHRLIELLFSMPDDFKINNYTTKYLQRETFKNYLPEKIYSRKDKIGFEAPQSHYMAMPKIRERLHDAIENLKQHAIIKKSYKISNSDQGLNWRFLLASLLLNHKPNLNNSNLNHIVMSKEINGDK